MREKPCGFSLMDTLFPQRCGSRFGARETQTFAAGLFHSSRRPVYVLLLAKQPPFELQQTFGNRSQNDFLFRRV